MSIAVYNEPIAKQISLIIENKGLKKCKVAQRANIPPQMLSEMLNGRRIIKACDIPKIAKALEVDPNDLYGIPSNS